VTLSADWSSDSTACSFDWLAEPTGELRIGVDLGGGFPFPKQLGHWRVVLDSRGSDESPGQFVHEQLPVWLREEDEPGEGIVNGLINRPVSGCVIQWI